MVKPANVSLIGAVLEPYDWKEVQTKVRVEWKCVLIGSGERSVMINGMM